MTDYRVISLSLVAFVLMAVVSGGTTVAVLSGGTTVAVLSDSQVVTTDISGSENGSASTTPTPTPTPTPTSPTDPAVAVECGIGETQHNGTTTDPADISITLEPAEPESAAQSVTIGEETTYVVTVEGANRNITAYNLGIALCDPSVATFEEFTHSQDPEALETAVGNDEVDVSAGVSDPDGIAGPTTILGTVTVTGDSAGQTHLGVVNIADGDVRVFDDRPEAYNVISTDTVELTVDEEESEDEESEDEESEDEESEDEESEDEESEDESERGGNGNGNGNGNSNGIGNGNGN